MKSQLERAKRQYANYTSVLPTNSSLPSSKVKLEQTLEMLTQAGLTFLEDPNFSVDDIYLSLSVLYDIQEQIWAQAKSQRVSQEVNAFVNTVSRPFSAFNRLGSFVGWGSIRSESIITELAEQGFFFRETSSVSQFENPAIEISDLSEDSLLS